MTIIEKLFLIACMFVMVYLWNRFFIKNLIKLFIAFFSSSKKGRKLDRPVEFMTAKEKSIYIAISSFYWLGWFIGSIAFLYHDF